MKFFLAIRTMEHVVVISFLAADKQSVKGKGSREILYSLLHLKQRTGCQC
jgi:hypothetical protein